MLYRLTQDILARAVFPLGEIGGKEQTRDIVARKGIKSAGSRDSQEICFLPDGFHYADFLREKGYTFKEGNFVDLSGSVIGKHKGTQNFTVGQRKNLGMTFGKPMFVIGINSKAGEVTLGNSEELFSKEVVSKLNWYTKYIYSKSKAYTDGIPVSAKIRYAAQAAEAVLFTAGEDTANTVFKDPQRAVTPGQSIVFYDGDRVIGGGIIE
jgi:tRNA-specific 2-thiouridylase